MKPNKGENSKHCVFKVSRETIVPDLFKPFYIDWYIYIWYTYIHMYLCKHMFLDIQKVQVPHEPLKEDAYKKRWFVVVEPLRPG